MDRFISAYVGRPQAIFERDYDTLFPSIDEPDEHEQWNPHNGAASSKKTASLSCFKELSGACEEQSCYISWLTRSFRIVLFGWACDRTYLCDPSSRPWSKQ